MDSDDLSDDAYSIILQARDVSGLLGAELATSGKDVKSEHEFLLTMLTALKDAHENMEDYLDDEELVSKREIARAITNCETSVRRLLGK